MIRMNEAKRAALRAEWETGRSNRDLARRYGVSEGIVRHWAKAETWQRDGAAIETIHTRAQMLTFAHFADQQASGGTTAGCEGMAHPRTQAVHPVEPTEAQRSGPAADVGAAGTQETLRELSAETRVQALAAAQIGQLDRAADLARIFDRLAELIQAALGQVDADVDPEAARKQSLALATLFAGGSSSNLASLLLVLTRMAESIQTQERRALGIEDRPKPEAMPGGQSEPVQTETASTVKKPDLRFDPSKCSPADRKVLRDADALINGYAVPRPIVMPPAGPSGAQTN